MNGFDLIQALTGVLPGQGANGHNGQGPQAGAGGGLFAVLLGQQLTGAALQIQPRGTVIGPALNPGDLSAENAAVGTEDGSPDGANVLLQTSAGEAAAEVLLASAAPDAGDVSADIGNEGQVLHGLINHGENAAAIEHAPVLAAALSEAIDAEPLTFAAGPNDQAIPAPFQGLSLVADADGGGEYIVGQLPMQAGAKAVLASGKEIRPTDGTSSADQDVIVIPAVADGENITTAAKTLGPAELPAAPQSTPARLDVAPLDVRKTAKGEANNAPRPQLVAKAAGEAQAHLDSDADGSGNPGRDGQKDNAAGNRTLAAGGAEVGTKSAPSGGIKTSIAGGAASSNAAVDFANLGQPTAGLQSHLTPLRALENSMALQAGLILPFDANVATDPMTGQPTSLSAQSLGTSIQALQAGTSISSPAHAASSFTQAPNFIANQVGLHITRAVADGQNEFTVRLNPPEMGRIEVRLEFQADGGVKAALTAEKAETLNLLQRDAAALERALNDAGVKTDSGSLNFSLQQGEAHAGHEDASDTASSAVSGEEADDGSASAAEIEITEQIIQQMVADGAVDIRV